jgi:phenylalanyl-tRNA synthetase alpha subunit
VFDETNGSQVEQVDLDELDDEEALCAALKNMSIGDVCPKESKELTQAQDQPSSSMQASSPTQDEDQPQEDEDEDQEIRDQRPSHPRVHQAIQRDHPVNSILSDIHKGVTTRS